MEIEEEEEYQRVEEQIKFDLDNPKTLTNFKEMGLVVDKAGDEEKKMRDLKEGDDEGEDFWMIQNAMKIERIKQKIERDAEK